MTVGERTYYDQRAREYDDWCRGNGLWAPLPRPGWHEEVAQVISLISSYVAATWLDATCGTGFLTRHLRGKGTALDQSPAMLRIAWRRLPEGRIVQADALHLPFWGFRRS